MKRPSVSRRGWLITGLVLVVALIAGAIAVAYYSPIMAVRSLDVTGISTVPREDVEAHVDVATGTPLLQVDTAAVANRVATIPSVESVTVDRRYPSTLAVHVTERTPTALRDLGEGRLGVVDRKGVTYLEFDSRDALKTSPTGKVLDGLSMLSVATVGPTDPTTLAALAVATALPDWLRKIVIGINASSPADVQLNLTRDRTVVWGDAERSPEKADALMHVIKLPGTKYNVSSPNYPAVS